MADPHSASFPHGLPNLRSLEEARRERYEAKTAGPDATVTWGPWTVTPPSYNPTPPRILNALEEAEFFGDLPDDYGTARPAFLERQRRNPWPAILLGLAVFWVAVGYGAVLTWAAFHPLRERQAIAAVHGFGGGQ